MAYNVDNYTAGDMLTLSWEMLKKEWKDTHTPSDSNFINEFFMDLKLRNQLSLTNIYCIILVAFVCALYRFMLICFIIKPFTKYFNFGLLVAEKLKESGCRLSFYSMFYFMSYYLANVRYPRLQHDISTQWTDYVQNMPVPDDIEFLYMFEAGYYFFAMYATYYLDVWKKDSVAMLLHHVLANCLIIFSFAVRYHRIGLMVLYLHDGADVILESTKLLMSFKRKKGWPLLTQLSNIGFVIFSTNWFWCRLVRYPQIVLFSSSYVARKILIGDVASFYFSFNLMLFLLFCLNIWWFHFIVLLIIRIVTGKTKEVEDTREYQENKLGERTTNHCINDTKKPNGTHHRNGYVSGEKNGDLKMKADDEQPAANRTTNITRDLYRRKEN